MPDRAARGNEQPLLLKAPGLAIAPAVPDALVVELLAWAAWAAN